MQMGKHLNGDAESAADIKYTTNTHCRSHLPDVWMAEAPNKILHIMWKKIQIM